MEPLISLIKKWTYTHNPHYSFRNRLGLAITSTILIFSLLLSWIVGLTAEIQIKADSGKFMEQLAYQMATSLADGMFVYYQQIQILASLDEMRDLNSSAASQRMLLEKLQQAYTDYAWIGLTNPNGIVCVSTGGILENKNVSERPWFSESKRHPSVQDVHGAKLLSKLLPNPKFNGEPLRFVDVASPVFDFQGNLVGVLGAHLYWQWAANLRDNLLQPLQVYRQVEVLILSNKGEVLLAPPLAEDKVKANNMDFNSSAFKLNRLKSVEAAQQNQRGFYVELWPDGELYLTGYAKSKSYRNYPGLGWIVLVRQSAKQAFAAARSLQQTILIWGTLIGLVSSIFAWCAAGRVVNPVLKIADVANRIREGEANLQIPIFSGVDEVSKLSKAVAQLFAQYEQQKSLLLSFNHKLEQKVQARTVKLDQVNQKLQQEINERKQAELKLQQLNEELLRLTMLDGLTGIANRRRFDEYLMQEWQRSAREQFPISLIMIDVDYFKRYNDFYGHQAGDLCLQQIAQTLSNDVKRSTDLVARYGGEEFAVILPNTSLQGATCIANSIRQSIKNLQIPHAESQVSQYVSLSVGVMSVVPVPSSSPNLLIQTADNLLYQAKQQGRDRIVSKSF
ncbi:diguanylate cyclase domain-containing protein [Anabaena azotica]|uniref:Diguanylate cyclase n=1 Tax=Anabaena azotica FACHB-119 TaxID=947527 RepID=A0ABR8DAA7_9NOST|nr:diguanylate cyclase [Anabaena azotica]MBD2504024.1 diguanylate cyclase [Anabaena azotica FACHB-119]